MRIRLAELADAEAIRAIYNVEVLESTNTFDMVPRTRDEQEAWILEHSGVHPASWPPSRRTRGDRAVGANGEIVLGFGSLSPFRERSGYSATAENSVYVDRAQRGKGVGKALLAELLVLASAHGFHSVIARIAGHNETSIGLHEAAGLRAGRAWSARSGASTASGSTWSSSSACCRRRSGRALGVPAQDSRAASARQGGQAATGRSATRSSSSPAGRWPRPRAP